MIPRTYNERIAIRDACINHAGKNKRKKEVLEEE